MVPTYTSPTSYRTGGPGSCGRPRYSQANNSEGNSTGELTTQTFRLRTSFVRTSSSVPEPSRSISTTSHTKNATIFKPHHSISSFNLIIQSHHSISPFNLIIQPNHSTSSFDIIINLNHSQPLLLDQEDRHRRIGQRTTRTARRQQ